MRFFPRGPLIGDSPGLWRGAPLPDPASLAVASIGDSAIGGGISAMGTLAGGNYAKQAGILQQQAADTQAAQLDMNATQAIASGQRQMLDTQMKTRLAMSSATARAGASGVAADTGSPLSDVGSLAKRGSYLAAMDMFNGQSTATGLENEATGVRYGGQVAAYGGQMQQSASQLAALGTLAGTAGSMAKMYGGFQYPTVFGRPGAGGF